MTNLEKLNRILEEVLSIKNMDEVDDNFGPDNIEDWDSLTHFDLVVQLEERFEISVAVQDVSRMYSIGDIKITLKKYGIEI